MTTDDEILYSKAMATDAAWSKELRLQFGKYAGDARYDSRGISTQKLRDLHNARTVAAEAWSLRSIALSRGPFSWAS